MEKGVDEKEPVPPESGLMEQFATVALSGYIAVVWGLILALAACIALPVIAIQHASIFLDDFLQDSP